jgi:signal transduction histidine kinase
VPLRGYLAGLAVLFVVAASAAVVYGRVQAGQDARAAAQADASFAAKLAAKEIGNGIVLLQQTVGGVAGNPGIATAFEHPEDCALTFGSTDAQTTGHVDLLRSDGSRVCSSLENAPKRYDSAAWLERAKQEPVFDAPAKDPFTGEPVVLAAAPIPKYGVVAAVFGLDGLGKGLAQTYGGPRGLEFAITDGKNVLTHSTDPHAALGKPLTRDPGRLYAGAPVPNSSWRIVAGADEQQALNATRRLNQRELTIILAGLALFLAATILVHRRIARPLARLSAQVRGSTADATPHTVDVEGPAEVATLATRLNELGAALTREQEAYRVLFEASPLPKWVYDRATRRILEANEAAVAGYGYTHEELRALTVDALEREPGVHVRKDGSTIDVNIAMHRIDFRGYDACVVIAEDVTEKERLRLQLQQSQRLESLGQLAGGVAHDFNNLLAVILGYARFIERRAEEGSRDESDVAEIRKAGERATRLTRQLLAFARREVVRPTVLDLTHVVLEMEQMLRRTLGDHVVLETSLQADLWPIMADYGQLEQVLVNLAVNARDAMPDGGTLTLDTENVDVDDAYASAKPGLACGRYVRLRASDTGVGMTPEVAARAFEPFFTTKPKGEGTGLGLATLHGIVAQAGGSVSVYSESGLGTTFTVLLPATDAPVPEHHSPGAAAPGGNETILVVEDEPAMLEVTRRILAAHGYEVLTAGGGEEALRIVDEHAGTIDLLLTDVVMPQMLGREVADRVAALRPGIAVLFMSGYAQAVIGPMGDLSAGHQIIDKPFTEATLLQRVRQLLASRAAP